jgi:gamma-glutamyl:cysteine ligase YbdK (ATP-grasp superfamily)
MGEEIGRSVFDEKDFEVFAERLRAETALLSAAVERGEFSRRGGIGGLELEAWIVDWRCDPSPANEALLEALASPAVVPELAKFNFEINVEPQALAGRGLARLGEELATTWNRCRAAAAGLGARVAAIGTLPTARDSDMVLENMSERRRYRALDRQVLRLRGGEPLRLDLVGREHLQTEHRDVMLEAAATSLQAHLQVPCERAARYFNASVIASAPTVAVAANAPFLFGRCLWEETRIPLFEQAVSVGGFEAASGGPIRRVSFGTSYVTRSPVECFQENLEHSPVLLPVVSDEPPERFAHVRLHNGTIWRWNRPLIGFDADGTAHFRVEHRVMSAGPTIKDMMANLAFYFGLAQALAAADEPPEAALPFAQARDNFYLAARRGLAARVRWTDGPPRPLQPLLLDSLLPLAAYGLAQLQVERSLAEELLKIVEARAISGRTGAAWQRAFVERHGADFHALVAAYLEGQESGRPVHEWDV